MKKIQKTIALALAVLMLAGMTALTAAAEEDDPIKVTLRIEGIEGPLYYNKGIELEKGETVADLMEAVNDMEDAPAITVTAAAFGSYISEIDGLAEFAYGEMSGWSYRVNGISPAYGADLFELGDGDDVVYFYGDPYGIGMQYPVPDLSMLLSGGVIKFTSIDATYDEDWNEILTENPVKGAAVAFSGEEYVTDENGEIQLESTAGLAGFHSLQVQRFDEETGLPTVLRCAPDFMVFVPFSDTPEGAWYYDAVMFCVREGYFVGTDAAQNLFDPLANMNMAQLFTVLARIGGVDPDLTTGANWYKAPLEWAFENDLIIPEQELSDLELDETIDRLAVIFAERALPRENFIYLFYRTAAITESYDMTPRADITGAADYDDIYEDIREAVSWAVATGIIRGTSDSGLVIDPGFNVNRATVCQMLLNYYK